MNGEVFLAEIREQPAALLRLLSYERELAAVAEALALRAPSVVRLVGHGTSDNAASYGVYAFGLLPGWTALRDSISLTVYYDAAIDFASSAVVALSQSGRTPDVVEYVQRARADGALTIALTNEPASELGHAAELVVPLAAGPEQAVAATKTYINELAALVLLAGGVSGRMPEIADGLRRVAGLMEEFLPALEPAAAQVAAAFAFVGRMFVIGRGLEFATAREIALKLTEPAASRPSRSRPPTSCTGPSPRSIRSFPSGRSRPRTRACARSSRPQRGSATPAPRSWRAGALRTRSPARPTRCPCRTQGTGFWPPCCRSSRVSSSRQHCPGPKGWTPTGRTG
jgi:glucosamine--fructose-6-phosphate aminotransferase (isomerizing)